MIAGFRRERLSPAIISGWEKSRRECNNLLELINFIIKKNIHII